MRLVSVADEFDEEYATLPFPLCIGNVNKLFKPQPR